MKKWTTNAQNNPDAWWAFVSEVSTISYYIILSTALACHESPGTQCYAIHCRSSHSALQPIEILVAFYPSPVILSSIVRCLHPITHRFPFISAACIVVL
jgi:hypothetical protein